jgi:riboflavin synthase
MSGHDVVVYARPEPCMFTGLIECIGTVSSLRRGGDRAVLEVKVPLPVSEIRIGDSIAVNGACLTVIAMQGVRFSFDISPETVARTTFANLSSRAVR